MPYDSEVPTRSTQSTIQHAESRPDAAAVQAMVNAIKALNLANGIEFKPFNLACLPGTFNNIWNSQRGDTPITFFQSNGNGGQFLPLGDVVTVGQSLDPGQYPQAPGNQLLFAPTADDPTALAHPVGFGWILDDKHSGNSRNIIYFGIVPPPGYVALGIAFNGSDAQPNANNYWCVRSDLVRAVGMNGVWSDSGQHWGSHNGDLRAPVASLPMPEPQMLFAPPTVLSVEGGNAAYALVMQQADLQITPFDAVQPAYDPSINAGTVTTFGLKSAKIMPYTAVADPGLLNQSTVSPFYFIAAEPYWLCTSVVPTPDGGSVGVMQTVGTDSSDSSSFSQETSMTVSADVGVAYGPVSLSASTSYTKSFGTTVSHSSSHSTQVQTQITLNLPKQPQTWIWERQTQITVFRTDTSQLSPVTYSEPDMVWVPDPK